MKRALLAFALLACGKESVQGHAPTTKADAPPMALASGTTSSAATTAAASVAPPTPDVSPLQTGAAHTAVPSGARIIVAPADADIATTVRAQRVKALEEKRTLVVYVGADWCPPCKRFKTAIENHEFDAKFADYTFLEFNLDRDGERLLDAGYGSKFIPLFILPGPDAKRKESFQVSEVKNKELAMKLMMEGFEKFRSGTR